MHAARLSRAYKSELAAIFFPNAVDFCAGRCDAPQRSGINIQPRQGCYTCTRTRRVSTSSSRGARHLNPPAVAFTSWPFLRLYTLEPRARMHVCVHSYAARFSSSLHRSDVHVYPCSCTWIRVQGGGDTLIGSRNLIGSRRGIRRGIKILFYW